MDFECKRNLSSVDLAGACKYSMPPIALLAFVSKEVKIAPNIYACMWIFVLSHCQFDTVSLALFDLCFMSPCKYVVKVLQPIRPNKCKSV